MEDYYVRYDNNGNCMRTDYLTKEKAERFYDNVKLSLQTTWKELWHEPIEEKEAQYLIKDEEVKVIDLGIAKITVPVK